MGRKAVQMESERKKSKRKPVEPGEVGHMADMETAVESAVRSSRYQFKTPKSGVKHGKPGHIRKLNPKDLLTREMLQLTNAFIPESFKIDTSRAVGSGAIFNTSKLAEYNKKLVELGQAPVDLISDRLTVYDAHNLILVDLKDSDQYFGNVPVYYKGREYYQGGANKGERSGFTLNFLRGNTSFVPAIAPVTDKNYRDYLEDIRMFGIASKGTCINQGLGQATRFAAMTLFQQSLNQSFYLIDSTFYEMSTKQDASPMTTVSNPRIIMFHKKFLETDNAWVSTVPGGKALYNSLPGSKSEAELLMKRYASSVLVGERLDAAGINRENTELNLAFQNLQFSDEAWEMVKHVFASFYMNTFTSLADMYIAAGKWGNNCLIGNLRGYEPGIIMPCHLTYMMEDRMCTNDGEISDNAQVRGAATELENQNLRCMNNLRASFFIPYNNENAGSTNDMFSRLFKDGQEWLNAQTPCRHVFVDRLNYSSSTERFNRQMGADKLLLERLYNGWINTGGNTSIPRFVNSENEEIGRTNEIIRETMTQNNAIYDNALQYIGKNLNPRGIEIFKGWNLSQDQMMDTAQSPAKNWDKRDFSNLFDKSSVFNSRLKNNSHLIRYKQGSGGVMRASLKGKKNNTQPSLKRAKESFLPKKNNIISINNYI